MAHVFISYSSKHRQPTERLCNYLKDQGLTVWYDQDALEARGPFDGQIRAVLHRATPYDANKYRRLMQRTTISMGNAVA